MNYLFKVKGCRELKNTVELRVIVQKDILPHLAQERTGSMKIDDPCKATAKQKQRISRNIKDISDHHGYGWYEGMTELLKEFSGLSGETFTHFESMSRSEAGALIDYLMEFIFSFDVPLKESALMRVDDVDKYLWLCLKYRRCAITGTHADIHHCTGSRIGMGGNRKTTSNVGRKLIALSRNWHTKIHTEGEIDTFERYRIHGITLSAKELIEFGISEEEIN